MANLLVLRHGKCVNLKHLIARRDEAGQFLVSANWPRALSAAQPDTDAGGCSRPRRLGQGRSLPARSEANDRGEREIWLEDAMVDRLGATLPLKLMRSSSING